MLEPRAQGRPIAFIVFIAFIAADQGESGASAPSRRDILKPTFGKNFRKKCERGLDRLRLRRYRNGAMKNRKYNRGFFAWWWRSSVTAGSLM